MILGSDQPMPRICCDVCAAHSPAVPLNPNENIVWRVIVYARKAGWEVGRNIPSITREYMFVMKDFCPKCRRQSRAPA